MGLEYARGTVEEALEATDKDWSDWASTQIPGNAFMTVEDAIIVADQAQDGGESIFGADEWYVLVVLSR